MGQAEPVTGGAKRSRREQAITIAYEISHLLQLHSTA